MFAEDTLRAAVNNYINLIKRMSHRHTATRHIHRPANYVIDVKKTLTP